MEFFDGVTPLGAATADTSGNALFNARSLTPGLHTISAVQRGSGAAVAPGLQISVPAAPAARFAAPASYALGIQPAVMAAHGLIATAGQGTVSVLLPGSASAAVFPGIAQPTAIIVADFNGDGANDIAVANATGSVAIYLNNGSGSYSNTATYQSGGHPSGMAFADFNNDGVPDLAIANETEHTVAILPGRADGSFGGPIVVGTNIAPHGIVAADLNGDGFADLALTGFASNTLSVLLGDGTGNFRAASTITVDNGPSQILAGDFNEDGATDLAVLSEVSHTVDVLLNNGSGAFTGGASVSNATSFTAGHVTGSTHLDLLVQIGSELQVFAGAGDGTFQAAAAIAASGAAQLLAAGDFNGDGLTDIAAADLSGVLSVFPAVAASAHVETGTASGNITADGVIKPQVLTSQMERAHALVSSSVTLASSNTASYLSQSITLTATLTPSTATGTVTFYAGQSIVGIRSVSAGQASMTTDLLPTGTYPLTARYSGDANDNPGLSPAVSQTVAALPQNGLAANGSAAAGATPHGVVTADFNNDGIADIAVADNAGSAVMVFLGNGNGGFSAGTSIGANSQPFGIAAVDVNGDGNTDLVVTNANAAEVTVLLGNGTGSFSIFGTYSTGNNPQGIAAADFNGDGIADLVVSNVTDGTLTVLLGHGDGSFPTTSTITVGNSPTSVAVADFNVDGLADIVATNSGSATVTILLGNGNGTFQTGVTYSAGTQPYWVAATDLNGDGYPDLAVANNLSSGADVSILLNKSSAPGTFPTRTAFTAGISPHYIGTGDFNGDGIPDLLVINKGTTTSNGTYTILTGSGTGTFTSGGNLAVGNAPWAAAIADFNRDGRTDAAAASSGNNDVYFLLGVGLYPDMTVSSSHTGSFTEGDAADTYTLTVTNSGSVSTTAPVMVADTLPAGLTATAISGSGWTCTLSSLSCSRSDVLAAGTSYPAITLTVSVASNAPLSVTNSVAVSGGGEVNTSNDTGTDVTTIIQTTTLSLVSSQNPSTSGQQVSFTATISNSAGTGT
ncbi:MAG TPA: FG-GAP-like repeat-containing protein, partial [Bryobacteraceae bacterium]|nr:FG-GAP-like repeat-containing protein [Bryobacteraceae bacterium]